MRAQAILIVHGFQICELASRRNLFVTPKSVVTVLLLPFVDAAE